jgi:hypothetical protein
MSIAAKFSRSWDLAVVCMRVLGRNKTLLVFPIVTFFFWVAMIILFFAPLTLVHTGYNIWEARHWETLKDHVVTVNHSHGQTNLNFNFTSPESIAYWVIIYVASMFFGTFANVAFYHEILSALRGGPVSISSGFQFALSRWRAILAWSLFAGAIGFLIRTIEERVGFIGKIIAAFIGTVWSVACLFVIPVLVENKSANPILALRHSASILKRTWGETIVGYLGLTFGNAIMAISSGIILIGCIVFGISAQTVWIPLGAGLVWLTFLFVYGYVMGVASHIYRGALYLYASEGATPSGFTSAMLDAAWKHRK